MSNHSSRLADSAPAQLSAAGRCARWARRAAVVATAALSLGSLGLTSFAAATAQAATATPMALHVQAAPAAATGTRLGTFDAALLSMINAKRTAAGAVALREVVGLDSASTAWSNKVVALGRYGAVPANTGLAAQTLSAAPGRRVFAQSVAKWYPASVKAADVFALYAEYPKDAAQMLNRSYRYVGIRTAIAADGTSVATLTYTDSAIPAQVVDPSTSHNPTGALTSAQQNGTAVQLRGRAADPDATTGLQVRISDTVGTRVVRTVTTTAVGGAFAATVPLVGYGTHTLCVVVVNQGPGANLSLGCTTARLGKLVGNVDTLRQIGKIVVASGWGYDSAAPTTPLQATVRLTGTGGTRSMTLVLNAARPDVARLIAGAGPNHGFRIAVPNLGKGRTTLCVTLLPKSAGAVATTLTCRSITVS